MKKAIIILIVLLISQKGVSQDYIFQSKEEEKKGWQYYFNDDFDTAKKYFKKSIEINPENNLAKVGLLNCYEEDELASNEKLEKLMDFESNEKDTMQWTNLNEIFVKLMIDKKIKEDYKSRNDTVMLKYLQFRDVEFRAMLLEEPFKEYRENGSLWRTGEFKNLRPIGKLSTYSNENKILFEYIYPETGNIVIQKFYTDNGELEKEIIREGDPLQGKSSPIKETIYWQKNIGQEPKYLFVSENGFTIYDKNNPVILDQDTPDNIIERDVVEFKSYIWKNGKRIPYKFCEEDGVYSSINYNSNIKTEYRWENCEKIIISETKLEE